MASKRYATLPSSSSDMDDGPSIRELLDKVEAMEWACPLRNVDLGAGMTGM